MRRRKQNNVFRKIKKRANKIRYSKRRWGENKQHVKLRQPMLKNETSFETNQEMLGMKNVLRGAVIKSQKGSNFEMSANCKNDKLIVKESVTFHNEPWIDRHNSLHNKEEKRRGCLSGTKICLIK